MQSLKTLSIIAGGAIIVAALYGGMVGERSVEVHVDSENATSGRHSISGNRAEFVLTDSDGKLEAQWRGNFDLTPDGNNIAAVDKKLTIKYSNEEFSEKLAIYEDDGSLEKTYWRDDTRSDDMESADALVLMFLRKSGLHADERVAAILAGSGVDGVLDEIAKLSGDNTLRRYITAFSEEADLSGDQLIDLTAALSRIDEDHDLRKSIEAIIEHQDVPDVAMAGLLETAQRIDGDHELRKIIERAAQTGISGPALEKALMLIDAMDGDHDIRKAAEALLAGREISPDDKARIVVIAGEKIQSDYDLHQILVEIADDIGTDPKIFDAWIGAFGWLDSNNNQYMAISAAAQAPRLSEDMWTQLIDTTRAIDSSHDRRKALEAIAENMPSGVALETAYREVAGTLSSEREKEAALAALN